MPVTGTIKIVRLWANTINFTGNFVMGFEY